MTVSLRTLAFGEAAGVWGAGWMPGTGDDTVLALGAGDEEALLADAVLSGGEHDGEWRLKAAAAELVVAPAGEAIAMQSSEEGIEGWDQLCRVSGRFERGSGCEIDCLGMRSWFSSPVELERYESIRAVSVWFEPDQGIAVTAFRPRKAKAHDHDVLTAAVIGEDASTSVEDPRLSTTYEAGGWPVRAGLELWLAAEEPERQYPRRASGQAIGPRARADAGRLELRLEPFHWQGRGRDGAGMYLLARRR